MNKKLIMSVVIILIIGGVFGFWLKTKDADNEIKNLEGIIDTSETWNPFAKDYSYVHTLSDFILSASNGEYVIKMTITLNFSNKNNFLKFQGFKNDNNGKDDVSSEGEGTLTPMEYIINDKIGDLILNANETQLMDRKVLKEYLIKGINDSVELDPPLISDIYIENYVIQ